MCLFRAYWVLSKAFYTIFFRILSLSLLFHKVLLLFCLSLSYFSQNCFKIQTVLLSPFKLILVQKVKIDKLLIYSFLLAYLLPFQSKQKNIKSLSIQYFTSVQNWYFDFSCWISCGQNVVRKLSQKGSRNIIRKIIGKVVGKLVKKSKPSSYA